MILIKSMKLKIILALSVLMNAVLAGYFVDRRIKFKRSQQPAINWFDVANEGKSAIQDSLPLDSNDAVFVGTSITEGFPAELLPGKNRGIGGNEAHHILGRIGKIAACKPKKIFVEVGLGDFYTSQRPVDTVYNNILKIVGEVCRLSPGTKVYIQSVLPVHGTHGFVKDSIELLNSRLKKHPYYIDLYNAFSRGGQQDATLFYDGCHPNYTGYKKWALLLKPYL